jgi:uncharacterized membrane protein YhaH (DUF805 family)
MKHGGENHLRSLGDFMSAGRSSPNTSPWSVLFVSAAGRVGRLKFLVGVSGLMAGLIIFENAVPQILREWTAILVYPALLFASACLLSKRLHDRGRSGWWAALILLAFGMIWPSPTSWRSLFVLVIVWAAVELGLMPSEQGANRFGPKPVN